MKKIYGGFVILFSIIFILSIFQSIPISATPVFEMVQTEKSTDALVSISAKNSIENIHTNNIVSHLEEQLEENKKVIELKKQTNKVKDQLTQTSLPNSSPHSSFSIPSIGLNNIQYTRSSVLRMDELDTKLLYSPLVEDTLAYDFCEPNGNTYLMGHSEPAYSWQNNYPAAHIFSQVHTLQSGDIVTATNSTGQTCSYQITEYFEVTTGYDGSVAESVFNNLFYPNQGSTLTIQTCVHGSATRRIILRGTLI